MTAPLPSLLCALAFGASVAIAANPAKAQNAAARCLAPTDITPTHLYGRWQLTLGPTGKPLSRGQVVFERHPEYPGSVRGTVERQTAQGPYKALVAGDVTDQGFHLEESVDGVTIDAVWAGDVVADSCGTAIKGSRQVVEGHTSSEPESENPFLLQKAPGWN